ncbi:hypothetical protein C8R43DRAFT_1115120 [Mycena crocata]|nr:hypothetical protein C8R43DRAFT_1115120 [Mycena crocata]
MISITAIFTLFLADIQPTSIIETVVMSTPPNPLWYFFYRGDTNGMTAPGHLQDVLVMMDTTFAADYEQGMSKYSDSMTGQ